MTETYTRTLDALQEQMRSEIRHIAMIWGYAELARQLLVSHEVLRRFAHRGGNVNVATLRDIARGLDRRRA